MRVARTKPGKKYAIVYDYIYDHNICLTQYISNKKHCRMHAYEETTVIPHYNDELIKFIKNSVNEGYGRQNEISMDFETKDKQYCVIEIDKVKHNENFDINKYEPVVTLSVGDKDD